MKIVWRHFFGELVLEPRVWKLIWILNNDLLLILPFSNLRIIKRTGWPLTMENCTGFPKKDAHFFGIQELKMKMGWNKRKYRFLEDWRLFWKSCMIQTSVSTITWFSSLSVNSINRNFSRIVSNHGNTNNDVPNTYLDRQSANG